MPVVMGDISVGEMKFAIKCFKPRKANKAKRLQNLRPVATQWLAVSMSKIIQSGIIPTKWKRPNNIAFLKLDKCGDDSCDYHPISLLCVLFKV